MKREVPKYLIWAALLIGAGLTSLLVLLLNIAPLFLSLVIMALLSLGSVPVAALSGSNELGPPLAVMAVNALAYAGITYVTLRYWRSPNAVTIRRATTWLVAPAIVLSVLACVPALNPLWPRGMLELKRQESELQAALSSAKALSECRAVLISKGIQFQEETESSRTIVLDRKDRSVTADEGDRVVSARFQTNASVFPCGYEMEIVLLFGRDEKLKQQYVHPLRICP